MIIRAVLGGGAYPREYYVLCLQTRVSLETFLRNAKVRPGSYAGRLVADLHDQIFRCSLDLKSDYERYYRPEYDSFGRYLLKRMLISKATSSEIAAEYVRSSFIFAFRPLRLSFLDEEFGKEFLRGLFEQMGCL